MSKEDVGELTREEQIEAVMQLQLIGQSTVARERSTVQKDGAVAETAE